MNSPRMAHTAAAALLCGLSFGCSDADPVEPPVTCTDELCLQEPASGFQMQSEGYEIQAGEDVEYCEVVQLPGDPSQEYYVERFEVKMTGFSHHLIVSAAEVGSETEANMTVGERRPCTGGDVFGGDLIPVTGSQQPYHDESFPAGVGRRYYGGQKLVFDYHYFNTTNEVVGARAAVNFHTTAKENITALAQVFGFVNVKIDVPAGSEGSFTEECAFTRDINVFKLTRHTHRWGTDFDTWFAGGERDEEHIFNSANYEDVDHVFPEAVKVKAGEGFRFRCDYKNTEDYTLKFGLKATDEMCILFGTWYSEDVGLDVVEQGCIKF